MTHLKRNLVQLNMSEIFLDWKKKIMQSKIRDVRSLFENKDYYRFIKARVALDEYYVEYKSNDGRFIIN